MDYLLFDYQALLNEYYNEEDVINNILKVYVGISTSQISELDMLFGTENKDLSKIRFISHSLKGSSYNLKAMALGNAAFELQKVCDSKEFSKLDDVYAEVKRIAGETFQIINTYLNK